MDQLTSDQSLIQSPAAAIVDAGVSPTVGNPSMEIWSPLLQTPEGGPAVTWSPLLHTPGGGPAATWSWSQSTILQTPSEVMLTPIDQLPVIPFKIASTKAPSSDTPVAHNTRSRSNKEHLIQSPPNKASIKETFKYLVSDKIVFSEDEADDSMITKDLSLESIHYHPIVSTPRNSLLALPMPPCVFLDHTPSPYSSDKK